ncbi:MAG TPA: trypsin-like peptidase domain-containing protein [Gemmataceae bacterium]|nr:trypsin-like peptidase domain-containing protein [Gemmataceae bacterium]
MKSRCAHSGSLKYLLLAFALAVVPPDVRAEDTEVTRSTWEKATPENLNELKAIQKQVRSVADKVMRCTVGVRIGSAAGSGVIVNKEGYVLTAGHVSGEPGRTAVITFPDGRQVKGKTLGSNRTIDSGLLKITDDGDWPSVEMGDSADLKTGQWCIAIGHPGGFRKGRGSVVRLGRVLNHNDNVVRTDCTIMGGDSGGPLFDLEGRVIAIHSRIGNPLAANIHVPVDSYRDTWDRLADSEVWGSGIGDAPTGTPFLGVEFDQEAQECVIAKAVPGSAADRAGIRGGDVVVRFDEQRVTSAEDLIALVSKKRPGDRVVVEVQRDGETVQLRVVLGKKP